MTLCNTTAYIIMQYIYKLLVIMCSIIRSFTHYNIIIHIIVCTCICSSQFNDSGEAGGLEDPPSAEAV